MSLSARPVCVAARRQPCQHVPALDPVPETWSLWCVRTWSSIFDFDFDLEWKRETDKLVYSKKRREGYIYYRTQSATTTYIICGIKNTFKKAFTNFSPAGKHTMRIRVVR